MAEVLNRKSDTTETNNVREYKIRGTKYIVNATVRHDANEDAIVKIRRLIHDEIRRASEI